MPDLKLPTQNFAYLSPTNNSASWLDHLVCPANSIICKGDTLHDKDNYDKSPIYAGFVSGFSVGGTGYSSCMVLEFVQWNMTKLQNALNREQQHILMNY